MLLTSGNLIAQQMTRTSNSHLCQHSVFISNVLFTLFLFFLVYSSAQGIFPPYLFCYNLENKCKTLLFHQISMYILPPNTAPKPRNSTASFAIITTLIQTTTVSGPNYSEVALGPPYPPQPLRLTGLTAGRRH